MNSRNVIRKQIEFDRVNINWFEEHYPHASLATTINLLMERFRHAHEKTPVEVMDMIANELKEELK